MKHLLLALAWAGISLAVQAATKPNFIFILTDDQGWADAHFNGHPYVKTPNLDRLAAQGTWFKQFYVAATVCSPSRSAFMTSHFPARHQIHGHFATHEQNARRFMPDWLDTNAVTVTRLLQHAGYATAHFGKWHLGNGTGAPSPGTYGIDVHRTVNSNGPKLGMETASQQEEREPEALLPYFRARSTTMIVDETIRFIRANRERPFYVNVWTLVPHAPLRPTPEQLAVYADLEPRANDPAFGGWMQKYLGNAKDLRSQMQVFCASLTDLDTQIGRLLNELDTLHLSENTVVFFSSDNGPEDYRIGNAANAGVGSTGPLRARKRSMYEGGIRTFGVVRWPGHVPAGRIDSTTVLSGVDFLPTVCALAGVEVPAKVKPDGEDMSRAWLGQERQLRKPLMWEWLFTVAGPREYKPPLLAIRDGRWKCFANPDGTGPELYDIPADPAEEHEVAAAHPETVKSLSKQVVAWQQSLPPSQMRTHPEVAPARQKRAPREKLESPKNKQ